jgi:hypothetical protein
MGEPTTTIFVFSPAFSNGRAIALGSLGAAMMASGFCTAAVGTFATC